VPRYPGSIGITAYAKHSIKVLTLAHDPSLRIADPNYAPGEARIAKDGIAGIVLAKYADTGGVEAISHHAAATSTPVFSENARYRCICRFTL
jgi:hypothetical protein